MTHIATRGSVQVARSKFTTTIDGELLKQIKIKAIECNTDVNKIIEDLIREYLSKEKEAH